MLFRSAENTAPGETGGTGINNEPCILIGTVSFTMRGTQEQMFSFVDQLEQNYPAVHIRSMQMNPRVFLDSGWEAVEELEAAFELEIYMSSSAPACSSFSNPSFCAFSTFITFIFS